MRVGGVHGGPGAREPSTLKPRGLRLEQVSMGTMEKKASGGVTCRASLSCPLFSRPVQARVRVGGTSLSACPQGRVSC